MLIVFLQMKEQQTEQWYKARAQLWASYLKLYGKAHEAKSSESVEFVVLITEISVVILSIAMEFKEIRFSDIKRRVKELKDLGVFKVRIVRLLSFSNAFTSDLCYYFSLSVCLKRSA